MGKESFALMTGLFMTILLSGTVVIIIWMSGVQQQTQTYIAETKGSVAGLRVGSTVFYRGIEVGKVKDISFDSKHPTLILVPLEINKGIKFTQGVYATLDMKGVTGLTQLALKDKGDNSTILPTSQHILIEPSLIERISGSSEQTITQVQLVMERVNTLLNDENIQHVQQILVNVASATQQLNRLQDKAEATLEQVPALTNAATLMLSKMMQTADEFRLLSQQLQQDIPLLAEQSKNVMQTGNKVGQQLLQTTLPRANTLMMQLQATTRRFDRVGSILEHDPQAFLLGTKLIQPAPGESGFEK